MEIIEAKDAEIERRMETLTYRELRNMLPAIMRHTKLPRPERLMEGLTDEEVFMKVVHGDSLITVYRSGIFLYQDHDGASVAAVSWCMDVNYRSVCGGNAIGMGSIEDLHWFWVLMAMGMDRVWDNRESREGYHVKTHYDADSIDWTTLPHIDNSAEHDVIRTLDRFDREQEYDRLWQTVDTLSPRQREIVHMVYEQNRQMCQIAEELHISRPSVSLTHMCALRNLKKKLSINSSH